MRQNPNRNPKRWAILFVVCLATHGARAGSALEACATTQGEAQVTACTAALQASDPNGSEAARILTNRGGAYGLLHKYDLALADLNRALEITPSLIEARTNRGVVYVLQRRYEDAVKELDYVLKYNSLSYAPLVNRASANLMLGRLPLAAKDANEAIRIHPGNASGFRVRSMIHYVKGEYEEGEADLRHAVQLAPDSKNDFTDMNIHCWSLAMQNRELETALAECDKAVALEPNNAQVLDSRGLAYFRLNRFDDAIRDFDAAVANDAGMAPSLYVRGIIKRQRHDPSGDADIAAARAIWPAIDQLFAHAGIKPE